eukprot:TRINITY_DN425_c0_g6_i1.p1 TRINITY_DN425_c0_g6~~TRINITY_DN425_c0_g6_i1.p1  ORF type:complete len:392 (-),score=145.24 TRINITY_DN425_c0_g6_i1:190-1365(-)
MVLEATVICLDNSEYMRNGDYVPTRMEAQHDAVNLICGAKTQSNPENVVAAVASAGRSPTVLVTLTSDLGKLLSSLHGVSVHGELLLSQAIQVAQLALKHRQNKNQQQRIVAFVGSPLHESLDDLVKLAKRLKKNNVAVDIVNFGEEAHNTEKLEAFVSAVNNRDNSHLVTVPAGPHVLSDILISSPIISGDEGAAAAGAAAAGGGGGFSAYGGVDPNLDPELALAIKMSMDEERARQEAAAAPAAAAAGGGGSAPAAANVDMAPAAAAAAAADDEDALLQQALAMSMAQEQQQAPPSSTSRAASAGPASSSVDVAMADADDDEEMRLALQMSMAESSVPAAAADAMQDAEFVNSVLASLPGVDPTDPRIQSVLASLKDNSSKDQSKDGHS